MIEQDVRRELIELSVAWQARRDDARRLSLTIGLAATWVSIRWGRSELHQVRGLDAAQALDLARAWIERQPTDATIAADLGMTRDGRLIERLA